MATITTILASDIIAASRVTLNTNFANLNADKIDINSTYADPAWITSLAGSKVTGNIGGNAATATALQTARTIAGVSFNGTANIAIPSTGLSDSSDIVRGGASVASGQVLYGTGAGVAGSDTAWTASMTNSYSGTGTATSGRPRLFLGTKVPSGDDSAILIGREIVGTSLFSHAIRDESSFSSLLDSAYASFDQQITITGATDYNHIHGYQSRPIFNGTGTLARVAGVSAGYVANGATTNRMGAYIMEATGSSTIVNQYGLYVNELTKANNNWAVYTEGTTKSYFGGQVQMNSGFSGNVRIQTAASTNVLITGSGTLAQITSLNDAGNTFQPLFVVGAPVTVNHGSAGEVFRTTSSRNLLVGTTSEGNFRLDIAASGSSGTLRVYDQTPTTGVTQFIVRAGAGQSTTNLQTWQNSGGTTIALVGPTGRFVSDVGYDSRTDAFSYQVNAALNSGGQVSWGPNAVNYYNPDVAIRRNGIGVIEVNNGTAGTFRDLFLRGVRPVGSTVANLPTASGNTGMIATVTDATVTTIGTTVAGGGGNTVLVWSNGTNWRIYAN
jgi:hypothetical protein